MNVVTTRRTPNHSPRRDPILGIVMHATASGRDSALNWLTHPRSQVSSHVVIDKTGVIWELAPDAVMTWHAGHSTWRGQHALNAVTLGCELVNLNTGADPYPAAQLAAAVAWCKSKVARYGIRREWLVRHSEVAIPRGRKSDPRGLDWPAFVARVFSAERWRVAHTAWVRAEPRPAGVILTTRYRGDVVTGGVVQGATHTHPALGTSDRWLRLASGGYIWLPQLEAR